MNDVPIYAGMQVPALTGSRQLTTAYAGPIRLRHGWTSKNVVMVRAMRAIGVDYAAEYLQRFGFRHKHCPRRIAGAGFSVLLTPMQVARGYAVMANGGSLVDPWFISKIENDQGGVIFEAKPKVACPGMRYSSDLG
ncbi:penicillin-binding transpeptidase domain-containing protein [Escherichia coli]